MLDQDVSPFVAQVDVKLKGLVHKPSPRKARKWKQIKSKAPVSQLVNAEVNSVVVTAVLAPNYTLQDL